MSEGDKYFDFDYQYSARKLPWKTRIALWFVREREAIGEEDMTFRMYYKHYKGVFYITREVQK